VFTNEIGQHLASPTVYNNFKRIVREIGLPKARFHDLRHSYAVAAIRSGDDIKTVQGNLGRVTGSFTLDVYGLVSEQMKKTSAERMERFIKGIQIEKRKAAVKSSIKNRLTVLSTCFFIFKFTYGKFGSIL